MTRFILFPLDIFCCFFFQLRLWSSKVALEEELEEMKEELLLVRSQLQVCIYRLRIFY